MIFPLPVSGGEAGHTGFRRAAPWAAATGRAKLEP